MYKSDNGECWLALENIMFGATGLKLCPAVMYLDPVNMNRIRARVSFKQIQSHQITAMGLRN